MKSRLAATTLSLSLLAAMGSPAQSSQQSPHKQPILWPLSREHGKLKSVEDGTVLKMENDQGTKLFIVTQHTHFNDNGGMDMFYIADMDGLDVMIKSLQKAMPGKHEAGRKLQEKWISYYEYQRKVLKKAKPNKAANIMDYIDRQYTFITEGTGPSIGIPRPAPMPVPKAPRRVADMRRI